MTSKEFKILSVVQSIILILVIILIVDRFVTWPSEVKSGVSTPVAEVKEETAVAFNIDPTKNFVYGDVRSPNSLIFFSRYNCSYCKIFYNQVLDSLLQYEVNEGKLNIVCKNLVTPSDETGMLMAKVAEVGRQTRRFEEIQAILLENGEPVDTEEATRWAVNAGIPQQEVTERLNSEETLAKITEDREVAAQLDINATPSFYLNGKKYVGFLSYSSIKEKLN